MRKKYLLIIMIFFVLFSKKILVNAVVISNDTVVTESIIDGLEITTDCTIRFENTKDIHIGSIKNLCPGISIKRGVTLTLNVASNKNVNIYGGYYEEEDNEYDCAGIFVPKGSKLIINSEKNGELIVYPFGMGAGIGGNGVFIEKIVSNINCLDAGCILLKKGRVVIKNPILKQEYALGAGIGGGGICNVCDDVECLYGGNLNKFEIINGELTINFENEDAKMGAGAIIGGGGIANFNENIENIIGGNAEEVYIRGGIINIYNENSYMKKGNGAIIGGGGIYNKAKINNIIKGQLFLKEMNNSAKIKLSSEEPIFGDGNIYSNGLYVKGGNQIQNVPKKFGNININILSSLIDVGLICSGIFLIVELVT